MTSWKDHYVRRIIHALEQNPTRTVVHWQGQAVTASAFLGSVLTATTTLRQAGVGTTDTVAILTGPNNPVMLAARYAAHLLGAAVVHIRSMNPRSDAETFSLAAQAGILHSAGSRVLVVDEASATRGRELSERVAGLAVIAGLTAGEVPAGPAPGGCDAEFAPYVADDLAVIDFTSGSGGGPKMVRQPFGTRETAIGLLSAGLEPGAPATLLSVTPISHTTAPLVDAVLAGQGTVVLHEGFDADDVLRAFAEQRITDVYLAVPHLYQLLDHPGIADADLSSLRRVTYSGTPAAPARIGRAVALFGDALVQVYGSTEAGGITSLTPLDHREPELLATVGRPFPWVQVAVRDPGSAAKAERGQAGEVWVRSATVMAGYLAAAALTAEAIQDDWLRTGDLGYWDLYGYLHLTGRVGGIFKSGGLKLDPAVIEQALLAHPQVRLATVYGTRDGDYVEHIHAAVELHDSADCTAGDLRAHVAGTLTAAHAPAAITLWEELPMTGSGKPDLAFLTSRRGAS